MNSVQLIGNLTRDCEHRMTNSGTDVIQFSLAFNERNGETGYINCLMFGDRARALHPMLTKGKKVAITGKIRYETWERDGDRRSKIELLVLDIDLLSKREEYSEDVPF